MLYSRSLEDRQLSFFQSLLWHVVNGDDKYKSLVDPVVEDAQALVTGAKDYFTIDRDNYHVIVYLAEHDTSFLRDLDIGAITPRDYEYISKALSEQRQIDIA